MPISRIGGYLARYWREAFRSAMILIVLQAVVILILQAAAVRDSTINKPQNWIRRSGADVFVTLKGVRDYVSYSTVTPAEVQKIANLPNVEKVQGTILSFSSLGPDSITIQSYDPSSGFGGPWSLTSKSHPISDNGQVVVDRSLASELKLHLGSVISLGTGSFRVVGFSNGTSSIGKQLVFMTTADALKYLGQGGIFTHALIKTANPELVSSLVSGFGVSAWTTKQFVAQNHNYWYKQIGPVQNQTVISSALLGGLVLFVVLLFAAWMQRRTLAMQSALGVSPWRLICEEYARTLVLCGVGFLLAILGSYAWIGSINHLTPGLDAELTARIFYQAIPLVALMATLALIPSAVSMYRTDPATILREA
ncbi:MAG: ABC transporter permease [Candidatus Saccharimonadia bacterium]